MRKGGKQSVHKPCAFHQRRVPKATYPPAGRKKGRCCRRAEATCGFRQVSRGQAKVQGAMPPRIGTAEARGAGQK